MISNISTTDHQGMPAPSPDQPQQQQATNHQGSSLMPATGTHTTSSQFCDLGNTTSLQQVPMMNRFIITDPATLQGPICYFDASLLPDNTQATPRPVGLGILISNLQVPMYQSIYIQAHLQSCTLVLMAEAAALALAALITSSLNITGCTFLSDCEQLVHFINSVDQFNPPDWRIKPFTQIYSNSSPGYSSRLCKISRNLNHLAHGLARQTLSSNSLVLLTSCSNNHASGQCFVPQALQSIDLHLVTLLVASCC
jgi:hypothetical protein